MAGNLLAATGLPALDGAYATVSVANDAAGNTYISGSFHSTSAGSFDLDPTHDYPDNHDIIFTPAASDIETGFVAKFDSSNNFQWVQAAVPAVADGAVQPASLVIGASGTVYFSGSAYQTFAMGSLTLNGTTSWAPFMGSIDANGNMRWLKAMPTVGDFAIDESHGRAFVTTSGATVAAIALPPNQNAPINTLWTAAIQGQSVALNGIAVDTTGAVITVGGFHGTADFDPGTGKLNLSSGSGSKLEAPGAGFVWKLSTDGKLVWADVFQGAITGSSVAGANAIDVAVDASNNIVAAGNFTGGVDMDPGKGSYRLTSAGMYDIVLVKLSSTGNFTAAARYGSARNDNVSDMAIDSTGNVYLVGGDAAPVDGHRQTNVLKYSSNLTLLWDQLLIADGGLTRYTAISVSPTGTINVVGTYYGLLNADSDPDPELNSGDATSDFFWLQFSA